MLHMHVFCMHVTCMHITYQRKSEEESVSVKRRVCSISEVSDWNLRVSSSTLDSSCSFEEGVSHDWRRAGGKKERVFSHHLVGKKAKNRHFEWQPF